MCACAWHDGHTPGSRRRARGEGPVEVVPFNSSLLFCLHYDVLNPFALFICFAGLQYKTAAAGVNCQIVVVV
jgi:hypothetical protein